MKGCIVGWSHLPFGRHAEDTVETLVVRAAREALDHAGIGAGDVDEIVLGHFNAGFSKQDFTASLVLQADDALRFVPATRVENACATGSAAVRQGLRAIEAGQAHIHARSFQPRKLKAQRLAVPLAFERRLVVGENVGPALGLGQRRCGRH